MVQNEVMLVCALQNRIGLAGHHAAKEGTSAAPPTQSPSHGDSGDPFTVNRTLH